MLFTRIDCLRQPRIILLRKRILFWYFIMDLRDWIAYCLLHIGYWHESPVGDYGIWIPLICTSSISQYPLSWSNWKVTVQCPFFNLLFSLRINAPSYHPWIMHWLPFILQPVDLMCMGTISSKSALKFCTTNLNSSFESVLCWLNEIFSAKWW